MVMAMSIYRTLSVLVSLLTSYWVSPGSWRPIRRDIPSKVPLVEENCRFWNLCRPTGESLAWDEQLQQKEGESQTGRSCNQTTHPSLKNLQVSRYLLSFFCLLQGRRNIWPLWRLWHHSAWIRSSNLWVPHSLPSQVIPFKPKINSPPKSEFWRHTGRPRWHYLGRLWSLSKVIALYPGNMLSSCQERRHDLRDEPIWSDEVSLLRQGGTQVCPTSSQTYGTGQDACVKTEPPPQSKECKRFSS